MPRPRGKLRLKIAGRATDIRLLARAVMPDPAEVTLRVKALAQTFGDDALALLLDVTPESIHRWTVKGATVGPCSRRAVWTLYGMVYAPHELATLFDYATYGRFTAAPLVVSEAEDPTKPAKKPRKRTPQGTFMPD